MLADDFHPETSEDGFHTTDVDSMSSGESEGVRALESELYDIRVRLDELDQATKRARLEVDELLQSQHHLIAENLLLKNVLQNGSSC